MPDFFQKAINATFYANPVKLQQLIDEGHFNERLLEDTGLLSKPFPIWRIPQCWEEAMGTVEDWSQNARKAAQEFLDRTHQIKAIYQKTFGIEYGDIDYHCFAEDFGGYEDDESIAEVLGLDNEEDAYAGGINKLDVDLFCCANKYDFLRIKELLLQGANPGVPMNGDHESLYDWLDFWSGNYWLSLRDAWNEDNFHPVEDYDVRALAKVAALEKMYRILKEYNTHPEPVFNIKNK